MNFAGPTTYDEFSVCLGIQFAPLHTSLHTEMLGWRDRSQGQISKVFDGT
jgi:hypothetical protein